MITERIRGLLEQPPASVSVTDLDRAVDDAARQVAECEREISLAERQLADANAKLEDVYGEHEGIAAYRDIVLRLRGLPARTEEPPDPPESQVAGSGSNGRPSKRGVKKDAILRFVGLEVREADEISRALIDQGLMTDSKADLHALQVTLSRMVKRDELERPRPRAYRLFSGNPPEQRLDDAGAGDG